LDDNDEAVSFLLPPCVVPTSETDVVPKPQISSLVFVFYYCHISSFKFRYVCGMKIMFVTVRPLNLQLPCQSVSYIVFDCISRISTELQRIMSNRRGNQSTCSSSTVQISHLAWVYLLQKLDVIPTSHHKVCTTSSMRTNDLAMVKVKSRVPCEVMRLDDLRSIIRLIAVLGNSAIVGVRKPLPSLSKKLSNGEDAYVSIRGGAQLQDVVNLVDVTSNHNPAPRRFYWNANGRFGMDLVYFPLQCSLRITIRYRHLKLREAVALLNQYGIAVPVDAEEQLSDEQLEALLRG
jgi:hypothetical protein